MTNQISKFDIIDFVEYVDSFYNPVNGIFPIKGVTLKKITEAIKIYIVQNNDKFTWGGGDSADREFVRDIILEYFPECEADK